MMRTTRREFAALGIAVAVFFAHTVVDKDWNYAATCGPLLLLAGALLGRPQDAQAVRRPLLAICAVAVALAAIYSLVAPWLAERELAFEACQAADLGCRSTQMRIAHGSDLRGVFHCFHQHHRVAGRVQALRLGQEEPCPHRRAGGIEPDG